MISKSIVIFYSETDNGVIKLLVGKHSIYKDLMFIGGGKKKFETNSFCASREIYEETKTLFGPIDYLHDIIENDVFKCRPIIIERNMGKIKTDMRIHIYFARIPYIHDINTLFSKILIDEYCFNELSDLLWINLEDLEISKSLFFNEDSLLLSEIEKESNIKKLISINQSKQKITMKFSLKI